MKVFFVGGNDLSNDIPLPLTGNSAGKAQLSSEIQEILKAQDTDEATEVAAKVESEHMPIHPHTPFPGISKLLPTLYLCGAGVAVPNILDKLDIRFIINVAPELPDTPLSSETKPFYLRINAMDKPEVDLSNFFDEVSDMIEEVRQHGGNSLVHCVAGVSRSATLCIAYFMKHMGMCLRDAYQHIKEIRPQIRPNSGFFQQLMKYEERIRGSSSVKMMHCESLGREIPDVFEPEYRAMEEFYKRHREGFKRR